MRRLAPVALAAVAAALLAACGGGEDDAVTTSSAPEPTEASAASTPSPTALPTLAGATAPPTSPTDVTPAAVVAGRVTAVSAGCVEVTTDDAVVWSLSGEAHAVVGDTVLAKVAPLAEGVASCGPGRGARLESLEVAGG
ncbi:hypothetical protein [Demequina litorisediminis]|uniref:Uncharacterized protein n=1 Tax=Demequina litorisediminis TaxID=1849022 RepID=A0ABQ6IFI2_9MICO|nr:hypothetical protein [Demequina litorisediminis]GMA36657.1 hypothetical protein GCM10025876_28610 [Demequina litorisediminis]